VITCMTLAAGSGASPRPIRDPTNLPDDYRPTLPVKDLLSRSLPAHTRRLRTIMETQMLISAFLALSPSGSPPEFDASDAEVYTMKDSVHLMTYDAGGELSAEIVMWTDDRGLLQVHANFEDGLYLWLATDGETATVDSDNAVEAVERMRVVDDYLLTQQVTEARWIPCAGAIVTAAGSCAAAGLACPLWAVLAACECLPELVEEWKDLSCPGFG
jgi:hypothetical protein